MSCDKTLFSARRIARGRLHFRVQLLIANDVGNQAMEYGVWQKQAMPGPESVDSLPAKIVSKLSRNLIFWGKNIEIHSFACFGSNSWLRHCL